MSPTEDESISHSITPAHRLLPGIAVAMLAFLLASLAPASAHADELPPGGTFVDDDHSVHEPAIEAIADEGVTKGCADERYCPRADVTRGQMAAFIARALALPDSGTDHFDDDDGHTFEPAINALAEAGITRGCGDGTGFCPDDVVSRGEMAAFMARADGLPPSDRDHFDDDDGHTFEPAINALAADGITRGCDRDDPRRFCPDETTRRGQMATFLTRFLDLDPITPPPRVGPDASPRDAIAYWFPDNTAKAIAVADCESSLNPKAISPNGAWHGIFQIAVDYHRSAFERVTGQSWSDGIYNAYYNAQYARDLYERQGWGPWGCRDA